MRAGVLHRRSRRTNCGPMLILVAEMTKRLLLFIIFGSCNRFLPSSNEQKDTSTVQPCSTGENDTVELPVVEALVESSTIRDMMYG